MLILGIETSCDETSAAVYESSSAESGCLRSNVVASQVDLHAAFGGVVPELSARAHVERLPVVVSESLRLAGLSFSDLDSIAVTARPGLLSALLCGISFAKGLSLALDRPLYAVDHVKAHVAAAFLEFPSASLVESSARPINPGDLPVLALVASGGHTLMARQTSPLDFQLLGTTRDDAVGEAFDKVGQLLGLPFPGGPHVERAAASGDPSAFSFPVGIIRGAPLDFSFSGLKTAVLYALAKMPARERRRRTVDVAASFQRAAIRALSERAVTAVRETGIRSVVLCGGVAANRTLRQTLSSDLAAVGARLFVPPAVFCGDTGAQVAVYGSFLAAAGCPPVQDVDASTTSELFE